jgi:pimeloyl-ACP methyl ester carboxylesterase
MFAGMLAAHNSSGTWGKFDRTAWWWDSFECHVVSEIDNVRNVLITSLRKVRIFFAFASLAPAQQSVSFPTQDGGVIYADQYGKGDRAVVLAHGGRFQKDGWAPQARTLAATGFRVLAIDFRGEGKSHGGAQRDPEEGRHFDVLGAVHHLRKIGAKSVSVVGASMGGDYAAEAADIEPAAMDRLVLLASGAYTAVTKMKGPKLFILARDDANDDGPRLPKIRAQYLKALDPKELIIVDGSAHAQFLFETDQGERVMHEILRFLSE